MTEVAKNRAVPTGSALQPAANNNDSPPAEIKQLYRSVYALVKELDEQRRQASTAEQLFAAPAEASRAMLVEHADSLIFQPHTVVGRKAREILWRKGYYDVIAQAKRLLAAAARDANGGGGGAAGIRAALAGLIAEGIRTYKTVVLRMNRYFKLDLRYLVDLRRLREAGAADDEADYDDGDDDGQYERFPLDLISYGLETVHAALLSLGDLHRYLFDLQPASNSSGRIERSSAARFYHDAFKLNTKIGMAQNQLGTLHSGQTFDLDAVYHYLYSLVCAVPFELSQQNVSRVFVANAEELRRLDAAEALLGDANVGDVRVFMTRFKRLAQICFYDRQNGDGELQALGHQTLCDLRALLLGGSAALLSGGEFMFKVVAVLLFGVLRLQRADSATVHTVNALLVAVCAELVDAANAAVDRLLASRQKQCDAFGEQYGALFELFDRNVRLNRKVHKENASNAAGGAQPKIMLPGGGQKAAGVVAVSAAASSAVVVVNSSQSGASGASAKDESVSPASSLTPGSGDNANIATLSGAKKTKATPQPQQKKPTKMRGRRRRRFTSDESNDSDGMENDSDGSSDGSGNSEDESDYELDSDFSSDEEEAEVNVNDEPENAAAASQDSDLSGEHFVYPNGTDAEPKTPLESMLLEFLQVTDRPNPSAEPLQSAVANPIETDNTEMPAELAAHENLRYKRRYNKTDPNLIVEFAQHDGTLRALKILFDWLQANPQLLTDCHATNPEFVHKIMRLCNHLNVDVFSRKVFFDRTMLRCAGVRADLERLFVERAIVPLAEDVLLKDFALLRDGQQALDFEMPLREELTDNEEHVLRIFKLVDFGFYLSKTKLFGYRFCARSRMFVTTTTTATTGEQQTNGGRSNGLGGGDAATRQPLKKRLSKQRRMAKRAQLHGRTRHGGPVPNGAGVDSYTSNEENELLQTAKHPRASQNGAAPARKGYLKNRNQNGTAAAAAQSAKIADADTEFPALTAVATSGGNATAAAAVAPNKFEIMGKLWLRSEVKTLESEVGRSRQPAVHVTPFLVIDAAALTDYAGIVKQLIKLKKFVVLIPSAVLSELDGMKKSSEGARNAIRWLESEISKGCRYLRMQRSYESQPLAMLKTPRKLDRDDFNFLQIAQFCNYMQASHADDSASILTLLTGGDLRQRQSSASPALSYTGIMNAIAVHFEQIVAFYGKYKNK